MLPATTWNIPHNLGYKYVNVEVIDSTGQSYAGSYDFPTVTFNDTNNITLGFVSGVSGYAAVTSGGGVSGYSGSNYGARVVSYSDATSITINTDTTDLATQANTQTAGTLTINSPSGTPVNGQRLMFRLRSTNVQTFSWNAIFAGSTDLSLPSASTGSDKYDYTDFIYNSTASKWQILAKNFGF